MSASYMIEHQGVVTAVDDAAGMAEVRVDAGASGCGGCAASAFCRASKGETLQVPMRGISLRPGQRVRIGVSNRAHTLSVALTLLLPWAVMVGLLCLLLELTAWPVWLSVLISIAGAFGLEWLVIKLWPELISRVQFKVLGAQT